MVEEDFEPGPGKVELCHNGMSIWVAPAAVQAHLDHGDTLGPCPEEITVEPEVIEPEVVEEDPEVVG